MNFVADEGVDAVVVAALRRVGHQVTYIAEMSPGVADTAVFDLANQERAILLTADKDFGDLVYRQQRVTQGVILLRLHGMMPELKADIVSTAVRLHEKALTNAFTVITDKKVRIRPQLQ